MYVTVHKTCNTMVSTFTPKVISNDTNDNGSTTLFTNVTAAAAAVPALGFNNNHQPTPQSFANTSSAYYEQQHKQCQSQEQQQQQLQQQLQQQGQQTVFSILHATNANANAS